MDKTKAQPPEQNTEQKSEARPRLSRSFVLKTALEVADREGIAALTMRRLAQELTVEAMSLYHHISNKDDLQDGMIDLVFAEIDLPPRAIAWKRALRLRSISVRRVLVRHPWATGLMESRTTPGVATLRHHDAVLGCLRENGFSLPASAHAYSLLDSYIYGFVLQEINLPFQNSDQAAEVASTMMVQMPAGGFPYLSEMVLEHVLQPGYAYADEFEVGLELVLDSLERLRDAR